MRRPTPCKLIRGITFFAALIFLVCTGWGIGAVHAISPRTDLQGVASLVWPASPRPGSLRWHVMRNDRINILFMAHGGAGGDNPNYTDTMLVLSMRPLSHGAAVIALPRYLWVQIPAPMTGVVDGKLYSAYAMGTSRDAAFLRPEWLTATGPGDLAAATVASAIGEPINGWIAITNEAFAASIDAIGGVRLTVPNALDDPNYPSDDARSTIHVHFNQGPQTLDGRHALEYARSRLSTSESDRSHRQELLLTALLNRLQSPSLTLSAIDAMVPIANGVRTNFTLDDIHSFERLAKNLSGVTINRITIEDTEYVMPKALTPVDVVLVASDGSYAALQRFIAAHLP